MVRGDIQPLVNISPSSLSGTAKASDERHPRLEQQLRVTHNRLRRAGQSRRGLALLNHSGEKVRPSDLHLEVKRLLILLGQASEAAAMDAVRKGQ